MSFQELLVGSPQKNQQLSTVNPQQQQVISQILKQALSGAQGLGQNQFNFAPIAEQARQNYTNNTIPTLAERFAGIGGLNSSGFAGELARGAGQFNTDLAALQSQYGLQNQGQQMSYIAQLLGLGLRPTFENIINPAQPGLLHGVASGVGQGLGMAAGSDPVVNLLTKILGVGGAVAGKVGGQ